MRCFLSGGSLLRGYCDASLSLGVADIVNDLHTGLDVIDAAATQDIEDFLKAGRATSAPSGHARA